MPQFNPVNEQIMQRMSTLFGTGYEYAYLYPGLQKVVQAAGRVIRTQQDQGYVYLIDDRYCRPEIQALLPTWWDLQLTSATQVQVGPIESIQRKGQFPTEHGGR
ncbi:helicase C-terminal domain-containing protein [Chitinimonas sp. JJ19]|uniref:helicase C-terminal domain-containing protein n=1 Tax=Chitinimonas sp. JJ19 TaxID=3109352 RepID=UPI0030027FFC